MIIINIIFIWALTTVETDSHFLEINSWNHSSLASKINHGTVHRKYQPNVF